MNRTLRINSEANRHKGFIAERHNTKETLMPRPFSLKSTLMGAGALTLIGLTAGAMPAHAAERTVTKTPSASATLAGQAAPERILVADNNRRERSRDRTRGDRRTTRGGDRSTTRSRDRDRRTTTRRDDRRRTTRRDDRRREYRRSTAYRSANRPRVSYNSSYKNRPRYRSNLGISFIFGNAGHSRHRWAASPFAFYSSGYGSYNHYTRNTFCQRVIVEGFHHGRLTPISVKQCSNPWDGTYIIQGSERLVHGYY